MEKVILSLGSSLGDRLSYLLSGVDDIEVQIGEVVSKSRVYESEPWGFSDKNSFLNMAIELKTNLEPEEILEQIKLIENKHLRKREISEYEARTLDIDIIFYGDLIISSNDLTIPHKHAHNRLFVLLPVSELEKSLEHPIFNKKIDKLIEICPDSSNIVPIT